MVRFNASSLLYKHQFRYLTGVTPDTFRQMVCRIGPAWERLSRRKNRSGRPYGVGTLEDHLLVLLILYRCHITQDFLALLYGVDKATICRTLRRIEPLAKRTLGVKRAIRVTSDEAQALIFDATEQQVHRPQRKQKCWYSGKKKRHCIKNEVIITEAGREELYPFPPPCLEPCTILQYEGVDRPCQKALADMATAHIKVIKTTIQTLISLTKNQRKESLQKIKKTITARSHAFACASSMPSVA